MAFDLKINHDMDSSFMGVKSTEDLNRVIKENKLQELIQLSEGYHDKRIVEIGNAIKESGKRLILLAGPSSSGKTTTAKKLLTQLRVNGLEPLYLGTDDYFVEREDTPVDENGKPNFEDLDAVDIKLFNENMQDLLDGKEADLPTFDFISGHKIFGKRITKIEESQPIVIEGIHALNDDLTPYLPKDQKFKIFVCPITAYETGNEIKKIDHRMLRRMVRDFNFRGYTAEKTIESWESVRAGEEKNIFPFMNSADVKLNTSCFYEIPVLKKYAYPLLKKIKKDSASYETAQRLIAFLDNFEEADVTDMIPTDSILREFVGGSIYADNNPIKTRKAFDRLNYLKKIMEDDYNDYLLRYKERSAASVK